MKSSTFNFGLRATGAARCLSLALLGTLATAPTAFFPRSGFAENDLRVRPLDRKVHSDATASRQIEPLQPSGAIITVTDLTQKISSSGGCSLPEAIYSANFDRNIAIDSTDPDHFVVTHCTPGNGDDTIVLPAGAVFQMSGIIADAYNPYGPTATPIIFSNINIEANGSTIQRSSTTENYRAFAVGTTSIAVPALGGTAKTISGTGQLKINNAYIRNFKTKGGNGASGGGGGLGAGGAIYLQSGQLTLVNSTFENNSAIGGNGSDEVTSFPEPGGGGGGLGGNGGTAASDGQGEGSGGGGGGSRGNGGANDIGLGGGGGGTYVDGISDKGGFRCGGTGGHFDGGFPGNVDATDGSCPGGGGGAGAVPLIGVGLPFPLGGDGKNGNYGGGGGGGGVLGSDIGEVGGNGGFGGGGGAGAHDGDGGNGGFGGGGGGGHHSGNGGVFAGDGTADNGHGANGGGGAGLGGAIFNDSGTLSIVNSTFTGNTAFGGAGGDSATSVTAENGSGQGNAIFSRNGNTVITHATVYKNGPGTDVNDPVDVAILGDGANAAFSLNNSILTNNVGAAPNGEFFVNNGGSVTQNNTGNLIGHNGASNGSGKFTGVTTALDPQLTALALNIPGSTPTMAIGTSSPAYGTANLTKCQATDQRGVSRKPGCDIGAYERNEFTQSGNTFTVTNTSDHDDGTCGIIDCTLREAISAANASTGAITINFGGSVTGTILLDRNLGSLFVGNLTVGPITINGPGAGVLAVSGNANIKVFSFPAGTSTVSGLTIRDGFPPSGSGTVIAGGVSIGSVAAVTFNDCAFINNRLLASSGATAGASGNIAQGGAIANSGTLTLNRCTFSSNEAIGGGGFPNTGFAHFGGSGGAGQGGAIYNSPSGTLTVNSCTFSNNLAAGGNGASNTDFGGGNGGAGQGGAISNQGTMTLTACTLSGNIGTGGNAGAGNSQVNNGQPGKGSGGITSTGNSTVRNSISAGNTGNHGGGVDADGTFTSSGYNLIGIRDGSSGFTATGDQGGTTAAPLNAKLGPLANNGGQTQTMALLTGSPALDKGISNGLNTDQRGSGFVRPSDDLTIPNTIGGDGSDIGAFEVQVPAPLVSNIQFSTSSYSVSEAAGFATISVTRTGDTSTTVTVDYATSDVGAQQRTDYTITAGTLTFAAGVTAMTFPVLIVDDVYVEGSETLGLTLTNPTGGAVFGSLSTATLTIVDNDSATPSSNPLDNAHFFAQQHYYDFLSRYPDQGGWDFWTNAITQCGSDPVCLRNQRVGVSDAFFYEQEYQQTGSYVFRLYRAAFGNNQPFTDPDNSNPTEANKLPAYSVFAPDRARVVGGASLAQGQSDFANAFVQRSEFLAKYPSNQDGPTFVDAILTTIRNDTGVDLGSQRAALINLFNSGGRGAVLYHLADDNINTNPINNRPFIDEEYNRAFVFTEYAGYLRRDADIPGFLFWLGQVNSAPLRDVSKQHAMVCSFITSAEYQQRFSPVVTHGNSECGQ